MVRIHTWQLTTCVFFAGPNNKVFIVLYCIV